MAMTPGAFDKLIKAGMSVIVERGAGVCAGFPDSEYEAKVATIASRDEVFAKADIICQVRTLGANPAFGGFWL